VDPHKNRFRLRRFYGAVASDQNRFILKRITGKKVLELGCGYGSLIQEAKNSGGEILGLDIDLPTLKMGKDLYPDLGLKLVQGDIAQLPFRDKSFHTVVLRESLHHVAWERVLPEILRICQREILIFEPNPNWLLKCCRVLISHKDQEVPFEALVKLLADQKVVIETILFRDLLAFPLSGGFVGREWVPSIRSLFPLVLGVDKGLQKLARLLGAEKALCWRYLVKGIIPERGDQG
jgi:ubiquinone/menaquinone biosynthesis C-methylase UbiE